MEEEVENEDFSKEEIQELKDKLIFSILDQKKTIPIALNKRERKILEEIYFGEKRRRRDWTKYSKNVTCAYEKHPELVLEIFAARGISETSKLVDVLLDQDKFNKGDDAKEWTESYLKICANERDLDSSEILIALNKSENPGELRLFIEMLKTGWKLFDKKDEYFKFMKKTEKKMEDMFSENMLVTNKKDLLREYREFSMFSYIKNGFRLPWTSKIYSGFVEFYKDNIQTFPDDLMDIISNDIVREKIREEYFVMFTMGIKGFIFVKI